MEFNTDYPTMPVAPSGVIYGVLTAEECATRSNKNIYLFTILHKSLIQVPSLLRLQGVDVGWRTLRPSRPEEIRAVLLSDAHTKLHHRRRSRTHPVKGEAGHLRKEKLLQRKLRGNVWKVF